MNIGNRIKHFRQRERISQMELELRIGSSAGAVSRIENSSINPTKETVIKIANALYLNHKELDFLIGSTSTRASKEEIEVAISESSDYLSKKIFGYLIDERWRLLDISDHFLKALKLDRNYIKKVAGTCTIEFLVNPELGITNRFSKEHFEEVLNHNLRYFYKEVAFMFDDPSVEKAINAIKQHEIASKIWRKIVVEHDTNYSLREGRLVYFNVIGNINVPFEYLYEPLLDSTRFQIVEFKPGNKFVEILQKLL